MTNAGNKFKYYPSETTDPNNRQASIPGLPTTANPIQHFPILYRPSGAIVYDGTNAGDVPVFWGPKERARLTLITDRVKLCYSAGAHADSPDGKRLPALAYALSDDVAKLLLQHGANVNVTHSTDETALCHLMYWGPMENRNWYQESHTLQGNGALKPSHARQDSLSTIKFFIHNAMTYIYVDKFENLAELLLAVGASPNLINSDTGQKRFVLVDALKQGRNLPIIQLLLKAGAEAELDEMPDNGLTREEGAELPIMHLTVSGTNPLYAREEVKVAGMVYVANVEVRDTLLRLVMS
ncbi:hypothetical protein FOXB_01357 [Fusarium oxysporum f. sp. conglutinans Fo5176]|uniref:Uncharacterized protein n=1 Tax=Fusarium oxysporum (strain Fo5176) TaxID=660025 RepID=F9F4N2_FUSOF|nr:hypothetical protein FOXB_01357 [Fusarium oxysporum f. sp. conglutinans Fo5176]